jgi:YVTN family beta-propeller protein
MKCVKFSLLALFFIILLSNCGGNKEPETPASPGGPASGFVNISITFRASTTDPNNDEISYQFDWGDGNLSSWSSSIPSGDTISVDHAYSDSGTYEIIVHAQDEKEKMSEWSEPHNITINYPDTNLAPITPGSPMGPDDGITGDPIEFQAVAVDPNGDSISYQFNWGDENLSIWSDYLSSGVTFSLTHAYEDSGTYEVIVRAQDESGATSDWSEPHSILINSPAGNSAPLTPNTPEGPIIGVQNFSHAFRASTTDPEGDDISYQFDWGDGTVSAWSTYISSGDTATVNRTYWGKGTYDVRVQARDEEEETSGWSEPLNLVIGFPDSLVDEIPVSDGVWELTVLSNGQYIYVNNSSDSSVYVVNTSSSMVEDTIPGVGLPCGIASLPNNQYVYVTARNEHNVKVIQTSTNTIVDTISIPYAQYAAASPDNEYLYVTSYSTTGRVYVVRTSDNTVVDSIRTGIRAVQVEVLPNGEYIYVSNIDNYVYAIRTSDNTKVDSIEVPANSGGLSASPNGELIYDCTPNMVYTIQTSINAIIDSVDMPAATGGMCIHPSGQLLYVSHETNNLSVIYTPTNTIVKSIPLSYRADRIEASPDGEYIYATSAQADALFVIGDSQ